MGNAHGERGQNHYQSVPTQNITIHQYAQIPDDDDLGITYETDMPNSHHLNVCGNAVSY